MVKKQIMKDIIMQIDLMRFDTGLLSNASIIRYSEIRAAPE